MPKLLTLRFPEGLYLLKSDNTELKRSKINFSVAEWHRFAVVG